MTHAVAVLADWAAPKEQQKALHELDQAIAAALDTAKAAGVPKGMIVALLHAHDHAETHRMVTNS